MPCGRLQRQDVYLQFWIEERPVDPAFFFSRFSSFQEATPVEILAMPSFLWIFQSAIPSNREPLDANSFWPWPIPFQDYPFRPGA